MLILQDISYAHPNKDQLFNNISLSVARHDKIALIGNNGTGKSTLLKIMAGQLQPASGYMLSEAAPYYIPQHFGQYNALTITEALGVSIKLNALKAILDGDVSEENMTLLQDDWTIEERCREALQFWDLDLPDMNRRMETLSGGQKTKVFLSGILIHKPELILMDEPTNHLDLESRIALYEYIKSTQVTLIVVSHDRTLLNLLGAVYELDKSSINIYGGNYEFYREQKMIEINALNEELKDQEKALRKARLTERQAIERQQKLDARGKKKQEKAGLPTISMNTLRNNAQKSTAKTKEVHEKKVSDIAEALSDLRKSMPGKDKMRIGFDDSQLHRGKILVDAKDINIRYGNRLLWSEPLNFQVISGARISVKGANGSGKTTLIKIISGELKPVTGTMQTADFSALYIDQDYTLIDNSITVYEQAQNFNTGQLGEHEIKSRLTHFLFTYNDWDKPCAALSGGEIMRLILCCLTINPNAPDMIILDEPTNNLDIQNVEILTNAISNYTGTIIVVSHDAYFMEQIKVTDEISLG